MQTLNFLTTVVQDNHFFAYLIIYIGLVFEGEFIVISAGILSHLGALNFWFSLFFILLGGISKSIFGYRLGQYLFKKYNHNRFFKYVNHRVHAILPRFKSRPFWSIFISKFIIGANNIVILFSGFEKVNYKKFLKAEIISTLIWAPVLLTLGYFFSYTALHISHEIWRFTLIVLVLFIMFVIFDKLVTSIYKLFEEFYNGIDE